MMVNVRSFLRFREHEFEDVGRMVLQVWANTRRAIFMKAMRSSRKHCRYIRTIVYTLTSFDCSLSLVITISRMGCSEVNLAIAVTGWYPSQRSNCTPSSI